MALTPNQRRQLDRQLESMGLLAYQNPNLTASQLNALISQANLTIPTRTRDSGDSAPAPAPVAPTVSPPPLRAPIPAPTTPSTLASGAVLPTSDPFRSILQSMIQYLSPEDQRLMADLHGPDILGGQSTGEIPSQLGVGERETYLSSSRAESALATLQNLNPDIQSTGGAGFNFLTNALNILRDFGGQEGGMTRENYMRFDRATRELLREAGGAVGQYGDLVSRLLFPGFSAGPLMNYRTSSGNPIFGSANRRLFT